jgi:hypothetical protein
MGAFVYASGSNSTVFGSQNYSIGNCSNVLGGHLNCTTGILSTIAGGTKHTSSADCSYIGGGESNEILLARYSTIGGGCRNIISSSQANIKLCLATIAGGDQNIIDTSLGCNTIGGGQNNQITGSSIANSTIAGGASNRICSNNGDYGSFIGGGANNYIMNKSTCSVITGGSYNQTYSACSFIGGGRNNRIWNQDAPGAAIVGGVNNVAYQENSFIGGGCCNEIFRSTQTCRSSAIGGGCQNSISSAYGSIIGGRLNSIGTAGSCSGIWGSSNTVNFKNSFVIGTGIIASAECTTFMNSGSFKGDVNVTGDVTANDFITTSDRNLKTNIQEIEEGLNTIKQFTAYEYEKAGKQDAGFIAQEVAEAIPYAVSTGSDGYLTMKDRPVLAHMHKAIIELEKRIKSIEDKLI